MLITNCCWIQSMQYSKQSCVASAKIHQPTFAVQPSFEKKLASGLKVNGAWPPFGTTLTGTWAADAWLHTLGCSQMKRKWRCGGLV